MLRRRQRSTRTAPRRVAPLFPIQNYFHATRRKRRCLFVTMSKVSQPELKRFLERRISVNIQGGRKIQGTLRGYDLFLNLVIDDAVEHVLVDNNQNAWEEGPRCGTVVRICAKCF